MLRVQLFIFGYTILLLLIIYGFMNKSTTRQTKSNKLFLMLIIFNIVLLVFEAFAWIFGEGTSSSMRLGNYIFTTATFAINITPVLLFFAYFDSRIFSDEKIIKYRSYTYGVVAVAFFTVAIMNLWNGFLFTIDDMNQYVRRDGMFIMSVMSVLTLLIYMLSIFKELKSVEGRLVSLIVLFSFVPIVGVALQLVFYGVPAIYTLFSLLILFAYLLIEREDSMKDTLTNLMTRGQFEQRLRLMIKKKQGFTIIMIDLDKFKAINDTYGHEEGDQTLVIVARFLECETKRADFICRYGGDEFMALIETDSIDVGEVVKKRISEALDVFNEKHIKPYTISMSFGILHVGPKSTLHEIDILTEVDRSMYEDKRRSVKFTDV
jgi:diguanylate cyclase (GGDEF)-like protein